VPQGISRILVIDASVARSAGISENPVSSATRQFLEWRRHQSKFAKRWRVAMYAKKKIVTLQEHVDAGLRARIMRTSRTDDQSQAVLKDLPLIEAALRADHIIVSRDENAKSLFQIRELNTITWVNPVVAPERVLEWLEQGAPAADEWKLGQD
jgi:hypothetical protein